jgi:hypothetical protein
MSRISPQFAVALRTTLIVSVVAASSACKAPQAYGERNSLIVRVDTAVWSAYETLLEETLEPRIYTVRDERTFEMTPVFPGSPDWVDLREWQQVVVLGAPQDPVVRDLLKRAAVPIEPWSWAQLEHVWARGQLVTVLAVPADPDPARLRAELERVHEAIDREYVAWVRDRMYASGVNDSLRQALEARGFSLRLPNVYEYAIQDSVFRFRNALPDPGTLIRSLLVSWVRDGDAVPAPARTLAWRRTIGGRFYDPPQEVEEAGLRFDTVVVQGRPALEMRGVWQDRAEFPAAGPFIVRAVPCPEQARLYYMDAWLYAPGHEDKYPYILQLETLLDSFRCIVPGR